MPWGPVAVWGVVGGTGVSARTGGMSEARWPLTGRWAESRAISDAVGAGDAGSIVISGAPGVGRTRLAQEALARAREQGRRTHWVRATAPAAAVPLGALAQLVPPSDTALDPFTLLHRALSAIDGAGREHPLLIGIDDAHLLDELSVTLVQQLVTSRNVAFVLTMRPGGQVANQLAGLCQDGAARRLELQPLRREDVELLLTRRLGGDVHSRTVERLWRLTLGHPLFLRELVEGGLAAGVLRPHDGIWRWDGEMRPTARLVEIVRGELEGIEPAACAALELLAAGEPLSVRQLVELSSSDAVSALERRGLATVDRRRGPAQARVAHPLYAAVVCDQLPEATACRIRRELAAGATDVDGDDPLRLGRLLLDGDEPDADPAVLAAAAARSNVEFDHPLAERLARAAVDASGGAAGRLALVEAVQWQGRHAEAEQLAREAAEIEGPARGRLVLVRVVNLVSGLGRAGEAGALLAAAARPQQAGDDEAADLVLATRALLAHESGRPRQAVELGSAVLQRPASAAHAPAAAAAAAGHALEGRTEEALAAVAAGRAALAQSPPGASTAHVHLTLAEAELRALAAAGRFPEMERRARELHESSLAGPEWAGDAVAALHRGWAALEAGAVRAAVRWLSEARAGLDRSDPFGRSALCAARLAQARELSTGGSSGAESPAEQRRVTAVFEPQLLLARAWQAAALAPGPDAASHALEAARTAADRGQWAVEAAMLHGAVVLGRPADAAARLRELAETVDGPLVRLYAEHAEALVADSGPRLDQVAVGFGDLGARLLAADAAASATLAHRRAGDRRQAAASTSTAAQLARACDGARTPALDQLTPPRLTAREEEVARLAVGGLNNQEIASRLVVSVRTVEAHLARVYMKLGIRGRGQLREAVPAEPAIPGPRAAPPTAVPRRRA